MSDGASAHLHDGKWCRCDGVGEISSWWCHCAHNGHAALALGAAQAADTASTLVEGGQAAAAVISADVDAALARGRPQAADTASAFVQRSQAAAGQTVRQQQEQ